MTMVNKINTGSNPINKLYIGSTEVQKAYLGDTLIYGEQSAGLLKFTADETNSTIYLRPYGSPNEASFETSTNGTSWSDYTLGDTITLANIGDSVYIRNKSETVVGLSTNGSNYYQFTMRGKIKASGDINYMLCKNSTDTLADGCYQNMFYKCTSLVQAPELPATTLADGCYHTMFYNCTSLVQAPELPATTLAGGCYRNMFRDCTSLVQAPELPATILTNYCYQNMFYGCTSLVQAPELPATILADGCYRNMFYNCTSIKLSETQDADYTKPYRIPTTGTGIDGLDSLNMMFANTGGIFAGTPIINRTYYLHKDNTIVG